MKNDPSHEVLYRVRAHDPITSVVAAEKSLRFAGTHREQIVAALKELHNATAHEISRATGLTVVQVDRRLPELARDGIAKTIVVNGCDLTRDGYRIWTLQKNLTAEQQKVAATTEG